MSTPSSAPKVCIACGVDCSNKPRTKDAQGRYTCKECFSKLVAAKQHKPAAPRASDDPGDDAVMAALISESAPSLTEACPSCGSGLHPGAVVCTICGYNKATGKAMRTGFSKEGGPPPASQMVKAVATAPLVLGLSAIGAAIGGALGAAVWAGVAYGLNREIAWVAIGVGMATGIGAALPAGKRAGVLTGLIAAVVAVIAVAGGKYAAASLILDDMMKRDKEFRQAAQHQVTDEDVVSLVAREVAKEHVAGGKTDQWPEGVEDHELAMGKEEFPPNVWTEAQARFNAETTVAKDARRANAQERYNAAVQEAVASIKANGFFEMFSFIDVLFFLVAIAAAFSAGSGAKNVVSGGDA